MSAELRARITAARAVYEDFGSAGDAYAAASGGQPDWADWSFRLAAVLIMLIDELELYLAGPGQAQPGGGWISGPSNPPSG